MSLATLLIVPPLNLLLAACLGAIFRRSRFGRGLLAAGLAGLVVSAIPVVPSLLIAGLEHGLPTTPRSGSPPAAIVILSGDEMEIVREGGPAWDVGALTLERERAGAALAKQTGLPLLVSGGHLHRWTPALADMMAESLSQDFGVTPRWREPASLDTWQNAIQTAAILRPAGIQSVYVVTHAWHMRRALLAFRRAGLTAVAAPVVLDAAPEFHAGSFVPSVRGWAMTYFACHEWIGLAWYALHA